MCISTNSCLLSMPTLSTWWQYFSLRRCIVIMGSLNGVYVYSLILVYIYSPPLFLSLSLSLSSLFAPLFHLHILISYHYLSCHIFISNVYLQMLCDWHFALIHTVLADACYYVEDIPTLKHALHYYSSKRNWPIYSSLVGFTTLGLLLSGDSLDIPKGRILKQLNWRNI